MYYIYYGHVRELHKHRHTVTYGQRPTRTPSAKNTSLRSRSLLVLSDFLLNLGQRIRPAQFQVHVHDGALAINTEGC